MVKIRIDGKKCKECGFCIEVCHIKNIKMSSKLNRKGYHYAEIVDEKKCTGCGICFRMCPDLCIEIEK